MNEEARPVYPEYKAEEAVLIAAKPGAETVRVHGTPDQVDTLTLSIAKARINFGDVHKSATGRSGNQTYQYAPLSQLKKATEGPLAQEGVCVFQFFTGPTKDNKHRLTTWVRGHGACFESFLEFSAIDFRDPGDCKAWGTLGTYLRRYTYQAVLQLDGDLDADDEPEKPKFQNKPPVMPQQAQRAPQRQPDRPKTQKAPQPAAKAPSKPQAPAQPKGGFGARVQAAKSKSEPPPPDPRQTSVPGAFDDPGPMGPEDFGGSDYHPAPDDRVTPVPEPAPRKEPKPPVVHEEHGELDPERVTVLEKLVKALGLKGPKLATWMEKRINKANPADVQPPELEFLIEAAQEELQEMGRAS